MRITTSKSKNSESFYIAKSYMNASGKSTSMNIRKLGTLKELSERLILRHLIIYRTILAKD